MMLDTLKELCALNGISGREEAVREYIISKLGEGTEHKTDAMGNLIVFKKGKQTPKNKVMLAAHMDEVGLLASYITDEGFIKFVKVGGIDTAVLTGKRVLVGEQEITGVIGVVPTHLRKKSDDLKLPENEDLYVDIGAASKEEAEKYVVPGDKICFTGGYCEFGNGKIKAKAIDDRAGCAVLLEMLSGEIEYDTYFAFDVQEEIGLRGASASAFGVAPDYAVVVETTTAADISGVEGEKKVCCLGEGAVVPFMDRTTLYSPQLFKKAFELAEKNNLKIQTKSMVAGGNDAGAIHKSRCGVKTVTVSFATRYIHSPSCVIDKADVDSVCGLVKALATEFAQC